MTDKKFHFPSMDGLGEDSPGLFVEDEAGNYRPFIPNDFDDDYSDEWNEFDTDEADRERSDDGTIDGELEAYNRVKELLGSQEDSFHYFPDDAMGENNRRFSMVRLQKEWGPEATKKHIGIANFFYKNFLNENLRREAERTGIASHYLLVEAFYKLAKQAESLAMKRMRGESEIKTFRYRGMGEITKRKLEEWCRESASRVYSDTKAKIIEMHGGISHGG